MAFTRVNPGGWAVGDILTSTQQNALDTDHANALDKSAAGDTISGTVVVNPGAIWGSVFGAIQGRVAGAIETTAVGGITLGGGASDWPTFTVNRTRSVAYPITRLTSPLASGWTENGPELIGPGTGTQQSLMLDPPHNGATINTIDVIVAIGSAHGGVPINLPSIRIRQVPLGSGINPTSAWVDLATTTVQGVGTAGNPSGATFYSGSLNQQIFTYFATQNNVVDTSQYLYYALLTDESSTNSIAGNIYLALRINYTAIADLRFQ